MLELLALFTWIWFVHLVIAVALGGPIVLFGWNRAQFRGWEGLAVVLPYVVWAISFAANSIGKSMANFGEPIYFAPAIAIAAGVRVAVGHGRLGRVVAPLVLVCLCIVAFGIYWFTPSWLE
jgi:hypothetical protein